MIDLNNSRATHADGIINNVKNDLSLKFLLSKKPNGAINNDKNIIRDTVIKREIARFPPP